MLLSLPSSPSLLLFSRIFEQASAVRLSPYAPISNGHGINPWVLTKKRRRLKGCHVATAENMAEEALLPTEAEEVKEVEEKYDWTEEWYPLYLTAEVPEDAPLGLTVFHKQIVLYRDFNGVLRCYEDRCPHRSGAALGTLQEGEVLRWRQLFVNLKKGYFLMTKLPFLRLLWVH